MKKNIIIISLVGIIEAITFLRWSSCWLFTTNFYFTHQNLATQLLVSSNEEKGLPIILIRLLHNKLTGLFWGVSVTFLQYIDIRFLVVLLSVVGGIGVYLGFWYFFTKNIKSKIWWGLFVLLFVLSFIEMFVVPHIDFSKRIVPLTFVLGSFSLYGIWEFISQGNKTIRMSIIVLLIILSLCSLLLVSHDLYQFCLKV